MCIRDSVTLAPFRVPRGTAETDIAAKLFNNFREMAAILNRHKEVQLMRQEVQVNKTRHLRQLIPGEMVFRRMPGKARPAKHLLGEPCSGPYVVVSQSSFSSAKLKDPATGKMLDDGADIPLEQILAGPRRGQLHFEEGRGERSIGEMVDGNGDSDLPPQVKASGWKHGKKGGGWTTLAKGQVIVYRQDESLSLIHI